MLENSKKILSSLKKKLERLDASLEGGLYEKLDIEGTDQINKAGVVLLVFFLVIFLIFIVGNSIF